MSNQSPFAVFGATFLRQTSFLFHTQTGLLLRSLAFFMFDLQSILWLTLIVLAIYYWRGALLVKDRAYAAAQKRCEEMQVQLLDETVYLRRLWFRRNDQGKLSLWRAFYFEFTVSGADRYFGRVIMLGARITQVELDAHRLH